LPVLITEAANQIGNRENTEEEEKQSEESCWKPSKQNPKHFGRVQGSLWESDELIHEVQGTQSKQTRRFRFTVPSLKKCKQVLNLSVVNTFDINLVQPTLSSTLFNPWGERVREVEKNSRLVNQKYERLEQKSKEDKVLSDKKIKHLEERVQTLSTQLAQLGEKFIEFEKSKEEQTSSVKLTV